MANGKLREYYWHVMTFLAERSEYLDTEHFAFRFPDEDIAINRQVLEATLIMRDGSRLFARASLDDQAAVREYDYAYIYYDHHGNRIFQYDDAPHHPEIATHPHHLHRGVKSKQKRERVYPLDVPQVNFIVIVEKVIERLESSAQEK
ncbi:MAG: hypothetical protein HY741_21745 [Chloroflexi bacterium]|nr:hypothetical protein [Chloroflexota bacterium]